MTVTWRRSAASCAFGANRGVVEAPFKSDSAERRISEKWRELGHDVGFGIGIAHGSHRLARLERHVHRPKRWIIYWDRVVKDHHHTVTSIPFKRAAVLDDDSADGWLLSERAHLPTINSQCADDRSVLSTGMAIKERIPPTSTEATARGSRAK